MASDIPRDLYKDWYELGQQATLLESCIHCLFQRFGQWGGFKKSALLGHRIKATLFHASDFLRKLFDLGLTFEEATNVFCGIAQDYLGEVLHFAFLCQESEKEEWPEIAFRERELQRLYGLEPANSLPLPTKCCTWFRPVESFQLLESYVDIALDEFVLDGVNSDNLRISIGRGHGQLRTHLAKAKRETELGNLRSAEQLCSDRESWRYLVATYLADIVMVTIVKLHSEPSEI